MASGDPAITASAEDRLGRWQQEARQCRACPLHRTRIQAVYASGPATARLLVIGEAPGAREDEAGVPFIGRSGQLLFGLLEDVCGLAREQCYVTNVVKCRPPGNRDPKPEEVAACRRFLDGQLQVVDPAATLCVGNFASRTVLGTSEGITTLRGRVHAVSGRPVVATFHPAYALRGGQRVRLAMAQDLALVAALLAERVGGAVPERPPASQ